MRESERIGVEGSGIERMLSQKYAMVDGVHRTSTARMELEAVSSRVCVCHVTVRVGTTVCGARTVGAIQNQMHDPRPRHSSHDGTPYSHHIQPLTEHDPPRMARDACSQIKSPNQPIKSHVPEARMSESQPHRPYPHRQSSHVLTSSPLLALCA